MAFESCPISSSDRIAVWDKPFHRDLIDKKLHVERYGSPWSGKVWGEGETPADKPEGVWYALGREWIDWASQNLSIGRFVYRLDLDTSKMLRLKTADEILRFTKMFGAEPYAGVLPGSMRLNLTHIRWNEVKKQCGGIEISPYQYSVRLRPDTFWYNTWDVASGCFWDPKVLRSAELICEE